jgi:hypothetical protein
MLRWNHSVPRVVTRATGTGAAHRVALCVVLSAALGGTSELHAAPPVLRVTAEAVAPGGFCIHVTDDAPRAAGEGRETQATFVTSGDQMLRIASAEDGGATLAVIRTATQIEIWRGAVRPLWAYGRVGLPGLVLTWRAAPGEVIYGLGERFNGLDQCGRRCEMWIKDSPGAGADLSDSYFCTPVLYSSAGYALFAADNPEGDFDLNSDQRGEHRYRRVGRELSCWLVFGADLRDLLLQRGKLQGPFGGVPDWVWGPWISRNSYETQNEAAAALQGMESRGLPVAAIVQEAWKGVVETGHFNDFSAERWPALDDYFALCRTHDIRTVLWQVPILQPRAPDGAVADQRGYFVHGPDGASRWRRAWLAGFGNIDFTNPDATRYWQDAMRDELRSGAIGGYKADDGEDIQPTDVFSDGRRGWALHNEYPVLYARALTDMLAEEHVDGVLWARSGSLGCERTPALWAGDQLATWPQLRALLPAGLSTGLSGMPFWGHDIGGYAGTPTPELYIRWLQFGTFSPLMQYHGITPREPWVFGEQATRAYRQCAALRMALRPTLIALGRAAAATGMPIMRPMLLEFPQDRRFLREETQYMLGPDLLVAPVLERGATGRTVLLPAGRWQSLTAPVAWSGPATVDVPIGLMDVPVLVREGAVLDVESASAQPPLSWGPHAPQRRVSFTPERIVIADWQAPLTADALAGGADLRFDAAPEVGDLVCTTQAPVGDPSVPGGMGNQQRLAVERDGRRCQVHIAPPAHALVAGCEQTYEIRPAAEREAQPYFAGSFRWSVPVRVVLDAGPRTLRGEAEHTVNVQVRSSAGAAFPVGLRLDACGAQFEQQGDLPAGGELKYTYSLRIPDAGSAASVPLRLVLTSGNLGLLEERAWLAPQWRWVVAGPFPAAERAAHRTTFGPETHLEPEVAFQAGARQVRWTPPTAGPPPEGPGLDFTSQYGTVQCAAAFAFTRLRSERAQDVEFRFGSDDTLRVWLNGEVLYDLETYRAAHPDQEIVPAQLEAGANTLLVKVGQEVGYWQFYARVTGPGDTPLTGVHDGFDDYAAFAPQRAPATQIIPPPASQPAAGVPQ